MPIPIAEVVIAHDTQNAEYGVDGGDGGDGGGGGGWGSGGEVSSLRHRFPRLKPSVSR